MRAVATALVLGGCATGGAYAGPWTPVRAHAVDLAGGGERSATVTVSAYEPREIELLSSRGHGAAPTSARCSTPCTARVPAGAASELYVNDRWRWTANARFAVPREGLALRVEDRPPDSVLAVGLGVLGGVMLAASLAAIGWLMEGAIACTVVSVATRSLPMCPDVQTVGLTLGLGGLVGLPGGIVLSAMAARAGRRDDRITGLPDPAAGITPNLAVTHNGATLGATLRF